MCVCFKLQLRFRWLRGLKRGGAMVGRIAELKAGIGVRRAEEPERKEPSGEVGQGPLERERLEAMERRGLIRLGRGGVPEDFWDLPAPEDPDGAVLAALLEDHEEGR